ncbi:L-cysteine:1D-myo-inositol 2-amino-2-deoxy-alpha-D-glucopyranoside ligase [Bogoriella caseilytica]|uniref:L-cysteine:1D-myo-inositol 2-amino-2-deoxy-alpha-D-glucopyranoside ligase n=1 Tax=Bogoriella caseilytica TaxID=56055 RepID=A0A3N2B8X9_9MICO|nr:L-cysteine:1D-myo-inositol 2-amino-2-deoxy-alpha-D-glucopyranoside ligase [Bogoriella caseilytica]
MVRLFDTPTDELQPVGGSAAADEPVRIYVCGITPYDATHLGHANTYVAYDLLVRALRDAGRDVVYAQNVTDVDDPLLERAQETGVDWRDLAESQVELFRGDMTALRVVPPTVFASVVDSVDLIAGGVRRMLAAGAAYRMENGDIYADLSADPLVGSSCGFDRERMVRLSAENGGDPDRAGKKDPLDPLLWRAERPGEPAWNAAELGRGRPGWHVECACLQEVHLGGKVDVAGGGSDLVFPHHELSESHLRVLTGNDHPVGVHSHAGMVGFDGGKMSKSRGNLVLVSGLLADGADPMAVRLILLSRHYRADWEYGAADLDAAQQRLERWRRAVALATGPEAGGVLTAVRAALAADLDAPAAVAAVDRWVDSALAGESAAGGTMSRSAPAEVSAAVDALLGVAL